MPCVYDMFLVGAFCTQFPTFRHRGWSGSRVSSVEIRLLGTCRRFLVLVVSLRLLNASSRSSPLCLHAWRVGGAKLPEPVACLSSRSSSRSSSLGFCLASSWGQTPGPHGPLFVRLLVPGLACLTGKWDQTPGTNGRLVVPLLVPGLVRLVSNPVNGFEK